MTAGRPTKYTNEMPGKVDEYLAGCVDSYTTFHKTVGDKSDTYERIKQIKLPSVAGLARFIGVGKSTLYRWADENKEFRDSLDDLVEEQEKRLLEGSISGEYNSTIAKLILSSNHGYAEKTETKSEVEVTGVNITVGTQAVADSIEPDKLLSDE